MNAQAASVLAQSDFDGSVSEGRGAEIFDAFSSAYSRERRETMTLTEYLERCRDDPMMYASAAERMLAAIGEPEVIDTARTRGSAGSS